jgi:hypothetical protein
MPANLRTETPPSAAISVLTVYAIFYGMPVGQMEHGDRCVGINVVVAIIKTPAQIFLKK